MRTSFSQNPPLKERGYDSSKGTLKHGSLAAVSQTPNARPRKLVEATTGEQHTSKFLQSFYQKLNENGQQQQQQQQSDAQNRRSFDQDRLRARRSEKQDDGVKAADSSLGNGSSNNSDQLFFRTPPEFFTKKRLLNITRSHNAIGFTNGSISNAYTNANPNQNLNVSPTININSPQQQNHSSNSLAYTRSEAGGNKALAVSSSPNAAFNGMESPQQMQGQRKGQVLRGSIDSQSHASFRLPKLEQVLTNSPSTQGTNMGAGSLENQIGKQKHSQPSQHYNIKTSPPSVTDFSPPSNSHQTTKKPSSASTLAKSPAATVSVVSSQALINESPSPNAFYQTNLKPQNTASSPRNMSLSPSPLDSKQMQPQSVGQAEAMLKADYPTKLIRPLQTPNSLQPEHPGRTLKVASSPSQLKQSPQVQMQQAKGRDSKTISGSPSVGKQSMKCPVGTAFVKTKAGQYNNMLKKENQDAYLMTQNFLGDKACHLYGVYDGHGENGAFASNFIKKMIPKYLTKEIKQCGGLESDSLDLPACLRKAYACASRDILQQVSFDVKMSGCTAVTVLQYRSEVYCANAGDSRAMIARLTGQNEWKQVELSKDHKPELPEEKARIHATGGRVQQSLDENGNGAGIYRVWKKNYDFPGLAMSRSMGDSVGRECGVIAEPEIIKHIMNEDDKMMVIASDGVWEFLSNSDVTRILAPYFKDTKIRDAADKIVTRSHNEWLKESEVVDDITCIMIFFNEFKEISSL